MNNSCSSTWASMHRPWSSTRDHTPLLLGHPCSSHDHSSGIKDHCLLTIHKRLLLISLRSNNIAYYSSVINDHGLFLNHECHMLMHWGLLAIASFLSLHEFWTFLRHLLQTTFPLRWQSVPCFSALFVESSKTYGFLLKIQSAILKMCKPHAGLL